MDSLFIDGEYVASHSSEVAIEVENPATEEIDRRVPDIDATDVDRAVEAARRAQREWRLVDGLERAGLLHRCADALEAARRRARGLAYSRGRQDAQGEPRRDRLERDCLPAPGRGRAR